MALARSCVCPIPIIQKIAKEHHLLLVRQIVVTNRKNVQPKAGPTVAVVSVMELKIVRVAEAKAIGQTAVTTINANPTGAAAMEVVSNSVCPIPIIQKIAKLRLHCPHRLHPLVIQTVIVPLTTV